MKRGLFIAYIVPFVGIFFTKDSKNSLLIKCLPCVVWLVVLSVYLLYLKRHKKENVSFKRIIFALDFFLITLFLYSLLLYGLYEFYRYSLDGSVKASSPMDKLIFYGYDLIIGAVILAFIIIPINIIYFFMNYLKLTKGE